MIENMDIALILDKIRPGAAWRMADTYENLKNTWEDKKQSLPTEIEIQTAWEKLQKSASVPKVKDVEPIDPSLLAIAEALAAQETRLAKLEGGVSK